jgi:epoxyqueuosine reductase
MNLSDLRQAIQTEAISLGFTHIGIAPPLPAPHQQMFLKWIEDGYHADMNYLARPDTLEKRMDPKKVLEDCQSILCLAMPYPAPKTKINANFPSRGRIASYAITRDYHEIIGEKLTALESYIEESTDLDVHCRSYVDTGPILERSYAVLAGLGMVGKNSCLIIQGAGSFFFLAEILTNLPLPVDQPFTSDLCKNCQRCIEACPTGCIMPDRTIDASRCISYLTIENKGLIPDNLKAKLGNLVFGCDICQMVCPHNINPPGASPSFGEPLLPEWIDLVELFEDAALFAEKYQHTPLTRAKRKGILRNAALVLGNQGCVDALPLLESALSQDIDPVVRDACGWAVDQIKHSNKQS